MTSRAPRFTYPDSGLPAGASFIVADFLRADATALVKELRQFIKRKLGHWPHATEVESWKTSIPQLQRLLDDPRLHPLMVLLEVALPGALGRIDCALLGSTPGGPNGLVVLELKAWSNAKRLPDSSDMLMPFPAGKRGLEPRVHPSRQAAGYRTQLKDLLIACHDETFVSVSAAAWLYNADSCARAPFNDAIFGDILLTAPIFGAAEIAELRAHISTVAKMAPTAVYLDRLDGSDFAPSRSLMERFTSRIDNLTGFALTDDQIEVFNRVLNAYNPRGLNNRRVIIVRGGPGAGKSMVALHLLKEFLKKGIPARYAARSQAIISTYNEVFPESKGLFASFMSLGPGNLPVLIVDEAHRLSNREQARECIGSARLTVFLIDDHQMILPCDIGSYREIEGAARSMGVNDPKVLELTSEKRCGSELYVPWLDGVLGIGPTLQSSVHSSYHFEIVESPHDLEPKLKASGSTWRMMAGMCWPWSASTESGEPVDEFILPEFEFRQLRSPHPDRFEKGTAEHRVAICWATEPAAQRHIGNVYTAQGFEFDYAGIIFGKDLVVRDGKWVSVIEEHAKSDKQFFLKGAAMVQSAKTRACLKNIYRVLLTRGRKGCYVFFQDAETKRYVERMIAQSEPEVGLS